MRSSILTEHKIPPLHSISNDLRVFPVGPSSSDAESIFCIRVFISTTFNQSLCFLSLCLWSSDSPYLTCMLFLTSVTQGVRSALSRLNKATEYSSSSDEVGSSDDEERNRWELHRQYSNSFCAYQKRSWFFSAPCISPSLSFLMQITENQIGREQWQQRIESFFHRFQTTLLWNMSCRKMGCETNIKNQRKVWVKKRILLHRLRNPVCANVYSDYKG